MCASVQEIEVLYRKERPGCYLA